MFRLALQMLGNLCGFVINYFYIESVGYEKTATEVSADHSALMRNIRRHEHALEGAIAGICRALLAVERRLGVEPLDEGLVRVTFDDSIIADTMAPSGSFPQGDRFLRGVWTGKSIGRRSCLTAGPRDAQAESTAEEMVRILTEDGAITE